MESNALAITNQPPATLEDRKAQTDATIEIATYWAKQLMAVVEKCGLAKSMGGKKYLEVEGWLIIAEFAHVRAIVDWVRPWRDDEGKLIGYEARVRLENDAGEVIGAGESSCGLDAFPVQAKRGSEKDKAAKSAAQTWAISRALRNKFSFVAKIAGYQPVPAEEMSHEDVTGEPNRQNKAPAKPFTPPPHLTRITEPQRKRLWANCKARGISEQQLKERLELYGFKSGYDITTDKWQELIDWASSGGGIAHDPLAQKAPPLEQEDVPFGVVDEEDHGRR